MNKIDKIIDSLAVILLSFLIALFSFAGLLSLILSNTFSDSDFMLEVIRSHNYCDTIYSEYSEELEALAIPAGIDEGVLTAVVSKEEFTEQIESIIRKSYSDNGEYSGNLFDYDTTYQRFYTAMTDFFTQVKGVEIVEEMHEGLDNVATLCAATCKSFVIFPFIDTLGSYAIEFSTYFQLAALMCAVGFVFLSVLLCITRKWRRISPYVIAISLLSSGLMLIAAPVAALLSGKIRFIQIETKSIYDFAVGYSERLLYTFINIGVAVAVLAVAVAVATFVIKYVMKRRSEKTAVEQTKI